LNGSAF